MSKEKGLRAVKVWEGESGCGGEIGREGRDVMAMSDGR
ncbi:hypothetical protein PAECIP111893_03306 [Paenibacillus plantiphilus]|uniref:Uncharacterized protein n=1 Tax=Paenibacillus plantiphilus TaxID=2905650 RepID=A0ABN8GMC9_9BACL|nr:hypothetical protein PAECIP111893_03306 [Paenibacillus plantiphilus]